MESNQSLSLFGKSIISTKDLNFEQIQKIFLKTKDLKKLWNSWKGFDFPHKSLTGKTIVTLFFEPSTRTRSSFELAAERLGANVLNLDPERSSTTKGESLLDTVKNLEAMEPNLIILRHASSGAPELLSRVIKVPIINAGDGFHEHPTQALLDAYTILEHKKSFEGLKILIVGDIAHSRVARSCIYLFQKLKAQITVCGPPSLIPPQVENLKVKVEYDLKTALQDADAVMMLRIQLERQNQMQFPTLSEYSRFWGLNSKSIQYLKKDAIIMHPGPLNEGVEISQEIADGPYSVILDQVSNGVLVRMALMELICLKN